MIKNNITNQMVKSSVTYDILVAHMPQELEEMLNAINTMSKLVGLNMHLEKTKVFFNSHVKPIQVIVDKKTIEEVDSYV